MQRTRSSTGLDRVQVEAIAENTAMVWLRANIEQVTDEEGNVAYEADEVSGIVSPIPDSEEIEGNFSEWWDRLADGEKTDVERIADLTGRLADAEERAALLEAAVVELAELYGGEQ